MGVGTYTFIPCSMAGACSIKISMPPLLILTDSAFPQCPGTDTSSIGLVISYGIGRKSATRSLCFWKSADIGQSHSFCPTLTSYENEIVKCVSPNANADHIPWKKHLS